MTQSNYTSDVIPGLPAACPSCNTNWHSHNTIPDDLRLTSERTLPTLNVSQRTFERRAREWYGWTKENDLRLQVHVVGVEDPLIHNDVLYWECTECHHKHQIYDWYDPEGEDNE